MSEAYTEELNKILSTILLNHPNDDKEIVTRAFRFAEKAHAGVKRLSGEPYFIHPMQVAQILADLKMDSLTCAAGLLHDVVEDTETTVEELRQEFGSEVAEMVDGVTKLSKVQLADREIRQAESLRKMVLATAKNMRVLIIKLADRLHNMRTLAYQPRDRQIAIAQETLDIYAPLSHRIGIYAIKWELEDIALRYLEPEIYNDLRIKVGKKRTEREKTIADVIEMLRRKLDTMGIKAEINGRAKHFYSIYNKIYTQHKEFEQIFDLIALRVIVETKDECYMVLGAVHAMWSMVPQRFKDYISLPKENGYSALHTTVIASGTAPDGTQLDGQPFEVQIKTRQMHINAEYGIAAQSHWNHKEGMAGGDAVDTQYQWMRQLLEMQANSPDSDTFMSGLKQELIPNEVLVFTPKGKIISLPENSTPIDFAYAIHTDIGNMCTGAKINGVIVPLRTPLHTGDRVEVMTSGASTGPKLDWLNFVKTSGAKTKIRAFFKREMRTEKVQQGREALENEMKREGYTPAQMLTPEMIETVTARYNVGNMEDLYAALGFGGVSVNQVMSMLLEDIHRREAEANPTFMTAEEMVNSTAHNEDIVRRSSSNGVIVNGLDGMLAHLARCCSPLPGDAIGGYITRGRGVSVHRADCMNLHNIQKSEPERIVSVEWAGDNQGSFHTTIKIIAYDKPGLLGELSLLFAKLDVPISAVSAHTNEHSGKAIAATTSSVLMTIQTHNKLGLDMVIRNLKKRSDVLDVFRM